MNNREYDQSIFIGCLFGVARPHARVMHPIGQNVHGRRDRRRECVTAVGQTHVKQMSSIPTGRIAVKDEAFPHDISVVCDIRKDNLFTFRSHMALCKHTGGTVGG